MRERGSSGPKSGRKRSGSKPKAHAPLSPAPPRQTAATPKRKAAPAPAPVSPAAGAAPGPDAAPAPDGAPAEPTKKDKGPKGGRGAVKLLKTLKAAVRCASIIPPHVWTGLRGSTVEVRNWQSGDVVSSIEIDGVCAHPELSGFRQDCCAEHCRRRRRWGSKGQEPFWAEGQLTRANPLARSTTTIPRRLGTSDANIYLINLFLKPQNQNKKNRCVRPEVPTGTLTGRGQTTAPLAQTAPMSKQREVLFPSCLEPLDLAVPLAGFVRDGPGSSVILWLGMVVFHGCCRPVSGSNIAWAFTDMNVLASMMYLCLLLRVSSEGVLRQRLCPNNARCCFRPILEFCRCLRKGRGGGGGPGAWWSHPWAWGRGCFGVRAGVGVGVGAVGCVQGRFPTRCWSRAGRAGSQPPPPPAPTPSAFPRRWSVRRAGSTSMARASSGLSAAVGPATHVPLPTAVGLVRGHPQSL